MASSFLSLVTVLVSVLIRTSPTSCDVITDVCSVTQNKPICYNTLKSNPRSSKADVKGIGYISLEISKKYAEETYKYIDSLYQKAKGGPKQDQYASCLMSYDDAIDSLHEAKKALDKFDMSAFESFTAAAFNDPLDCEDAFEKGSAPKQLEEANTKSRGLSNIPLAVGYILRGGKYVN